MSPDPLTYNQRKKLEAAMTESATKLATAHHSMTTREEIGHLERKLRTFGWSAVLGFVLALILLVALVLERADKATFGPFKVGYFESVAAIKGDWDYCQGVTSTNDPAICIWGPEPTQKMFPIPPSSASPSSPFG